MADIKGDMMRYNDRFDNNHWGYDGALVTNVFSLGHLWR